MALKLLGFIRSVLFVLSVSAYDPISSFRWSFAESSQRVSALLTECAYLKIVVVPIPSALTTITFVGTDPSNLTWQVNHAAGTRLMLSMEDAVGNSGGTGSNGYSDLYTVIPGQDASCLLPTPSSTFAIKANVTKDLSTCDYWGLRVTGGVPPYNIFLAAAGSPVTTKVSLSLGLDVMAYVNRVDSNGLLLAAVSDSTGKFGKATSVVNTIGSRDFSCVGRFTSYGSSSDIPFYYISGSKSKRAIITIAVCATIGGFLAITGATLFGLWMRRKIIAARPIKYAQEMPLGVFGSPDIGSPDSLALLPELPPGIVNHPWSQQAQTDSNSSFAQTPEVGEAS